MNDWVVENPSFEEQLMNNRIIYLNQKGINEVVELIENKDKEIKRLKEEIKGYEQERERVLNIIDERNHKALEHIDKELCNINVQENIMLKNELLKIKSKLQGVDKE